MTQSKRRDGMHTFWFLSMMVAFMLFVFAAGPSWVGDMVNYTIVEDSTYLHDFTLNITGYNNDVVFSFETDNNNITLENASGTAVVTVSEISPWVTLNGSSGVLKFNATYDNQTGFFKIPIQADNTTGEPEGSNTIFEFIINATNDAPLFTDISSNYSYNVGSAPGYNITAFDEESHYPLNFSIVFTNCTHANWLGIPDGENCTLFNVTNLSSTTAQLNYTGLSSDVGTYNATVTITEAPHTCPHPYCVNSTYNVTQSVDYNITIFVLATMEINASGCANQNFTEGVAQNCTIIVRTRGSTDTFNLTSIADFSTYGGTPQNASWFYPLTELTALNNVREVNITINASHSLVGNWDINFTASILNSSQDYNWSIVSIFVNWTGNQNLTLSNFNTAYNTSVNLNSSIPFSVTDVDFTIEDKDFYDEDPILNITVINDSSGLEVFDFFSFSSGVLLNDTMSFNLTFTPNVSHIGNYTVTVNATDQSGVMRSDVFDLEVFNNNFPYWNATSYSFNFTVNASLDTTLSNVTNLNLSRTFANDSDLDDILSFTNSSGAPPRFNLSTIGVLNFFPYKQDVGYWNFTVTVSDQAGLSNASTWELNVSNINTPVQLDDALFDLNGSTGTDFTINVTNDSYDSSIHILDDDIFILESQIIANGAYNETFTVNTTLVNTTVMPTPLSFNYTFDVENPTSNDTVYSASFTPIVANIGNYTVTVTVTDASGANDSFTYNLSIVSANTPPIIQTITNPETSYLDETFNFTIIANDTEDDVFGRSLNYTLTALDSGPALLINLTTGYVSFNFSGNVSYVGNWSYQVSVNDSDGAVDSENFSVYVNGYLSILAPANATVFNGTELANTTFDVMVDYPIDGLELTYLVSIDNITYTLVNGSGTFNYTNLSQSLLSTYVHNTSDNLTFNYTFNALDETYGLLKNLSLTVYRAGFETFNDTVFYKVNVTHADDALRSIANFSDAQTIESVALTYDLTEYFWDSDALDSYYDQTVNFTINQSDETGVSLASFSSFSGWDLSLVSPLDGVYNVSIIGHEYNDTDNTTLRNVSSDWFTVTVIDPPTQNVPTPSSSSSTKTVLQHYALKIVTPGDIELLSDSSIALNFSVINTGNVDLGGIDLSSLIELDGVVSDDVLIEFSEDYIELLAVGEQRDYELLVRTRADAVGEYRILIFANVTSPKFSDWGEFYIKVTSLDSDQLSQLLIFTEKLISENPECLELRELYTRAVSAFDLGNLGEARTLVEETIRACEEAITANEQARFFDENVQTSLFYSVGITLLLFSGGLVYYFYRRIKFKKLIDKEYI